MEEGENLGFGRAEWDVKMVEVGYVFIVNNHQFDASFV